MDDRSLKNLNTLHPYVLPNFTKFIEECQVLAAKRGMEYKVICGTRTYEEQEKLWRQGRAGNPGKIVTNARAGYSFHNFGLAIDCGVFKNGRYLDADQPAIAENFHELVAKLASKYKLRWGGNFKRIFDPPHFEYDTELTLGELRYRKDRNKQLLP